MDIFTLLGILYLATIAATDHCTLSGTEKNRMVNLNYTGDDAIVAFLGSQTVMTSSDCVNTCCHTVDCNVAEFNSRNDSDTDNNCHMYKCEGCKLKKRNKFTSYFINDENDVDTSTESTINSDNTSTLTSSTLSTAPSENEKNPEFQRIVLNKTAATMVAPDTVPKVENSVKGETLQESEINIPVVIPDLPSTLDDSQMLGSGPTGNVDPTQTGSSNVNSPANITPIVPGSATSIGTSDTSGTQGSAIESKPSTTATDDSPPLTDQTNTDTSPTSDNAPSEKPTTKSDTAPPSDSTQTDSSKGTPSTDSTGDSPVSNTKSSPDTASPSDTTQTDSSQAKPTTGTSDKSTVSNNAPSSDTAPSSDSTQTDSPGGKPSTDSSGDSSVSNTESSPDTAPSSDATQADSSSGNPTSNPNQPSSDLSEKGGETPTPKSTSSSGSSSDNTDVATGKTKVTSLPDNSKTPSGDSTTSNDAANTDNPPTSEDASNSANPSPTADQSSDTSAQTGDQASTVNEDDGSNGTPAPTADEVNSKKEETDTQQDLPDTYDAPFVDHPNIVSAALIAALSFGVLFFFAVTAIVGKRCYDGWQRRHYSRVDYLINGIYN
ncbi:MANSC domain-containing protein 1 [Mizuhopecten yessoensis]|uniref:MANSC domain-containing protein 1 n=1 Tax=Mizuhopecten yessoensis TaxID=6573 RepID=A0A210QTD8_MIZYE|nr:MANSC domain-containing protein 1 [Mizuhopecten yessoensis]